MISSPSESQNILVFRNIRIIPKFERGHFERGRFMRLGSVHTGDVRPFSPRISKTVQDRTKVAIDHLRSLYLSNLSRPQLAH